MGLRELLVGLERRAARPLQRISRGKLMKVYTMQEIRGLAELLFEKVSQEDFDLIVGIKRGGWPVAKYLAKRMGLKLDSIRISTDSHSRFRELFYLQGMETEKKPMILERPKERYEGRRILLVDDECHSGGTLRLAKKYLKGKVKTAVLVWVRRPGLEPVIKPDFWAEIYTGRMKVFPWQDTSPHYIHPLEAEI